MDFLKHCEFIDQPHRVETIPAQNVNHIIYSCCMSVVVVNKPDSCTLDVLKKFSGNNAVRVPSFCNVLKLWPY